MKYTRRQHSGVCCPRCGCRHVPTVGTYRIADATTRRYRECRHCGYRFTTTEYVGTRAETLTAPAALDVTSGAT
jgi:transcriptional regulator NrdR family protein